MKCSLAGKSRKQAMVEKTKNPLASCGMKSRSKKQLDQCSDSSSHKPTLIAPRKTSSLKVDCNWEVVIKMDPEAGHCFVKKLVDIHTNGCDPSPMQNAAVRARKGQTMISIPLPLAVTLRVLFNSRTKPSAIRDLLREHHAVPDSEPVYAQQLINLKMKLFKMGKDLNNWEASNFGSTDEHMTSEDRETLARFAREWVKDNMNEDNGINVLNFLQELKEKYPGFEYRYARDPNKCLSAWMFMTAEMQFFAKTYGQVLFVDWMKSGVSNLDWPYQGTVVLDEELSVHLCAHSLACTESNDSYGFTLDSMTSIVPELHNITKVTFSDRLASEAIFFKHLRSLKLAALCNWHLRVRNLGDEWLKYHPNKAEILEQFMWKIQNALVSIDQLMRNIEEFKDQWEGKPAQFMDSVQHEIHRFCAAYTHEHLLLFQTGNSAAESGNSSINAFLNENKPHSELVQTLVQYDTEQNNRERRDLMKMRLQLPSRLREIANPHFRQCLAEFSDKITEKYREQYAESQHYSARFIEEEGGFYLVQRKEYTGNTPRKVVWDPETCLFVCVCLTRKSSGCHCRHLLCVLEHTGHGFDGEYIDKRFKRRFNLPSADEIIAEFSSVRNSEGSPQAAFNAQSDGVEYELEDMVCTGYNVSEVTVGTKPRKTKLQLNYQSFMDEARKLGEFVQTSSELTDLATKSIQLLHLDLRSGRNPDVSRYEQGVGAMFEMVNPGHTELPHNSYTVVQSKSYLRMPGAPKRTRILPSSECGKKSNKRNSTTAQPCKICNGGECSVKFCRTLALYGHIVACDREHKYDQVLSVEVPFISDIDHCDYTADPFPSAWDHIVLSRIFRDERGFKYVRLVALKKGLELIQPNTLFTFTALRQWLFTKPQRKKLLLGTGVTWTSLCSEKFVRPRTVLRLPSSCIQAANRSESTSENR